MKPVTFKFGVVLALSIGGVIYTILRTRQINKTKPQKSGRQKNAASIDRRTQPASDKHEELANDSIRAETSPKFRYSHDSDKFLLPEFNELGKKDGNALQADIDTYKREINSLMRALREREGTLEIQMLDYCGLKEQEAVVSELKNRLKLNHMEAKIYGLKIESLQADNRRLEAKLSDYSRVENELEAARGKIKLLKKKLKFETEQNKELILTLQQRVQLLQDKESQAVASSKDDVATLQKMKNLEDENEELRSANHDLRAENSELAQKLDYTRLLANSVLEDQELENLKIENSKLEQQNKDLTNQIDQLKSDVQQLLYLQWVNACLRNKLRNYYPAPGVKDLGTAKSEAKAKTSEGGEKVISNTDSGSDHWSSTSLEYEDSPTDNSSSGKTEGLSNPNTKNTNKAKFVSKLKRLLTRKGSNFQERRRSSSLESLSNFSAPSPRGKSGNSPSSRSSVDLGKLRYPKKAFSKDSSFFRKSDVGHSNLSYSSEETHENLNPHEV